MNKGKLIIELEKNGYIDYKIKNFTLEELSCAFGAVLNNEISKGTSDKAEQVVWKVCALRGICLQLGLTSAADRLEKLLSALGCENDGPQEKN
ncbi:hypothetical protein [Selenomonas sp. AE3005]|uniref:hypothetical protein n=1 Tax=Selenomonas sp. AE3005 TaxID=1485543 RepID=UPI0025EE8ADC|nr:hypothetical protein [Selenomonas sp. AE3005]